MSEKNLTAEDALSLHGMAAKHGQMENGEYRFRLVGKDGNGYVRTVSTQGAWQKSHSHSTFTETYIIEAGWMALAYEQADGSADFSILGAGQIVTVAVGKVHNVYLPAKAVIHTVKHGNTHGPGAWHPRPEFDLVTSKISERMLRSVK